MWPDWFHPHNVRISLLEEQIPELRQKQANEFAELRAELRALQRRTTLAAGLGAAIVQLMHFLIGG